MRTLHSLHTVDVEPGQSGVTLRNGLKWADALDEPILLCECSQRGNTGCNVVGKAIVSGIWKGKFQDLPAKLIEHEHEEASRVYSGLLFSMRRAYGENWPEDSDVVAMTYYRIIE